MTIHILLALAIDYSLFNLFIIILSLILMLNLNRRIIILTAFSNRVLNLFSFAFIGILFKLLLFLLPNKFLGFFIKCISFFMLFPLLKIYYKCILLCLNPFVNTYFTNQSFFCFFIIVFVLFLSFYF